MSASFEPRLVTDVDWVRFLIGDIDVAAPALQDEEILGVLSEEVTNGSGQGAWTKYFAAARALEAIHAQGARSDASIKTKTVSKLSITYGGKDGAAQVAERAAYLRERGAALLLKPRAVFELL